MTKHTVLLLAANPEGIERLALDQEAYAIRAELKRSGYRERFDFKTRWAAEPLDLLRELRELRPTVVHFSGHGGQEVERVLRVNRSRQVPSCLIDRFAMECLDGAAICGVGQYGRCSAGLSA